MADESDESKFPLRYPPADITPSEFEEWIGELFAAATPRVDNLRVKVHDIVRGVDGTFDIDVTVRYVFGGMHFLVLVEAKRHKNAIKRELVQSLHSKVQSVGAQKGVMLATAGFQRGAIAFASLHGIALVSVTEGRFLYETRSAFRSAPLSRKQAREQWNLPTFAGHCYEQGESPDTIMTTLISTGEPEYLGALLFPVPSDESA
jgi:Restriction endonuclease